MFKITQKLTCKDDTFSILRALCILSVFTVSFDVFLVMNLGFNFRATQIFLFLPIISVLGNAILKRRYVLPPGIIYLSIWTVFILAYIPNSGFIQRGVAYGFWLVFSVLTIYTMSRIFISWCQCNVLLRFYLLSFFFVALFGILQFMLPLIGILPPLVTQWWLYPKLARINGFSYEPSYFSSYLIMGWVLYAWLLKKKEYLLGKHVLRIGFWTITAALILSSSRMGWLLMVLWFMHYPLYFSYRIARGYLNFSAARATVYLFLLALLTSASVINVIGTARLIFLVDGLGIAGTAAHSSESRTREFRDTIEIFAKSPLVGYSLGGISSAIGDLRGVDVQDIDTAKENEGMSIFVEVLAASGLIGVIPFLLYIGTLFRIPLKLARQTVNSSQSVILYGMIFSLFFELLILQMNQNILRPYLWMHIAILSAVSIAVQKTCKITT